MIKCESVIHQCLFEKWMLDNNIICLRCIYLQSAHMYFDMMHQLKKYEHVQEEFTDLKLKSQPVLAGVPTGLVCVFTAFIDLRHGAWRVLWVSFSLQCGLQCRPLNTFTLLNSLFKRLIIRFEIQKESALNCFAIVKVPNEEEAQIKINL